MKKRSKKRIPQDVKPWARLKEIDLDTFHLPGKKTSRWTAGARRDWGTRVLENYSKHEIARLIIQALAKDVSDDTTLASRDLLIKKLSIKMSNSDKTSSLVKYKNFCLFSGRARTYNRSLYVARHNLRKLVGVGLISGLVK